MTYAFPTRRSSDLDQRAGGRGLEGTAIGHFVEQSLLGLAQAEQLGGGGGLGLGELHLAEDRGSDQDGRRAADRLGDMLPAPILLSLDIKQILGEVASLHDGTLGNVAHTLFQWS